MEISMDEKLVSIIVPIYKVERYLEECLQSLINQSYKNLEIILVDDESPDNCPQICEAYKKKDKRFKVIHKKNGGAASARNVGLDNATGQYIAFVDSDDLIVSNFVSKLVRDLEESKADISVCSYKNLYIESEEEVILEKEGIYSEIEFLERFLWDWRCGLIWNKLFRAEVLENVRFTEGHVIDDEFFTYKAVMNSNRVSIKNQMLYFYRMRKSSEMNQGREEQVLRDRLEYIQERFDLVTEKYNELYKKYLRSLMDNLISLKRKAGRFDNLYTLVMQSQKRVLKRALFGPVDYKMKYSFVCSYLDKQRVFPEERNDIEVEKYFD